MDLNGNGLRDVWEERFGGGLDPAADDDSDGQSNAQECAAGTDPRDPSSNFHTRDAHVDGNQIVLRWSAQTGKSYRVMSAPDLSGGWQAVTGNLVATTAEMEASVAGGDFSQPKFYRVVAQDLDSDGDGVSDWDEMQLPGFDAHRAQSAQPGMSDLAALTSMLSGSGGVTLSVSSPVSVAVEKDGIGGVFRITRSGGLAAKQVKFAISGNSNIQRGSATPGDFSLRTADGATVSDAVSIPFGVPFVDVTVQPVADIITEVPETVTLTISADPAYASGANATASVSIVDAPNTAENERLFVAFLTPTATGTSATGLATVRLQGDNSAAKVNLSFSSLSSPQTQSILDLDNSGSGLYVRGLPGGQVSDFTWAIRAAAFLPTDQAMLDSLFAGQVAAVVNSTGFLEGEIRGNFQKSTGSIAPPTPGDPPQVTALTGEALRRDVSRFLTQATFGPTEPEIDALATRIESLHGGDRIAGYSEWMDTQFAMDQTTLEAYTRAADAQEFQLFGTNPINYQLGQPSGNNRRRAWWMAAVSARDQLRQRAAFALSQIFVISEKNTQVGLSHYGAARFYDQLGARATDNFRTLLEDVSKSPIMGTYLSHLKNQKATFNPMTGALLVSPDENFAREIMQLFTIGLVQLHKDGSLKLSANGLPIPTYSNADIMDLARVFTGWSFSRRHGSLAAGYPEEENTSFTQNAGPRYFQASWVNPMKNFIAFHDTGAKTVLGRNIPAGLDGEQDLDAALDILFEHPNTPPFISRLLIQRLVTATPSAGYIFRVAQVFENDGSGVRGNLRAVFRAILLDPEARNLGVVSHVGFGKQKEPVIRYTQLLRAFGATSQLPLSDLTAFGYPSSQLDNFPAGATRMRLGNTDSVFGQTPQASPTVFNWFLPDYTPGGGLARAGLVSPEMQITNETQIIQVVNYHRTFLNTTGGQSAGALPGATVATLDDIRMDRAPWDALLNAEIAAGKSVTEAVTALVDRLDLLLMAGNLRARYLNAPLPNPRSSIIDAGARATTTADRVWNVLYLMGSSPEFLHQK